MRKPTVLTVKPFHVSQSFMNDIRDKDVCPKYLKYKYVIRLEADNENDINAMFYGKYFEWHLLGETRDGVEPMFNKVKTGDGKPAAQKNLDEIVISATEMLAKFGLDTSKGRKQLHLQVDGMEGHIDWETNDIIKPDRLALYDVKYTETAYDDKYRGWGDLDTKKESQIQATHYVMLYEKMYGYYPPFYFLVFGKAGWFRFMKVDIHPTSIYLHNNRVADARRRADEYAATDWQAKPEFEKCRTCCFNSVCKYKADLPEIEQYLI